VLCWSRELLVTAAGADVKLVADTGLWCLKEKRPRSSCQAAAISGCAARIASICSGNFIVAAAGLLDGRRETGHWAQAKALVQRYPRMQVDSTTSSLQRVGRTATIRRARGLDPAELRRHARVVAFEGGIHRFLGKRQWKSFAAGDVNVPLRLSWWLMQ
jgi:hypothetical protein